MHRYHSMRFVSVTRPQVIFNGLFSSTNRCGFLLIKSTFPNYCVVRSYITTHKMHVFTVVHLVGNVCQWHAADIQWMPWKHWFSTLPVLHIFDPSLHEANLLEIFVIHKLFRVCLGWVLLEFSKICRACQMYRTVMRQIGRHQPICGAEGWIWVFTNLHQHVSQLK